jgi:myo-inositol-1(or 4)-monophosphatase
MPPLSGKRTNKKNTIDLRLVRKWLKEAGNIALNQRDVLNATSKPDGTLVTEVDRNIQSLLVDRILDFYPGHGILAEEGVRREINSEYLWTIDPIDGTRAYVSGLPVWGISVGILRNGTPHAGLFFMPATGETYWGTDEEAFFNNQPISLLNHTDLQNHSAFIAVPSNTHQQYEISFPRLRSLGSATAHLAYVARGVALAALTRPIYIWDIAPVLPLLKANDIRLVYLSGKELDLHQLLDGSLSPEPLVAAPASIVKEVLTMIHRRESSIDSVPP